MNHNKEAKSLTLRRGSEVSQQILNSKAHTLQLQTKPKCDLHGTGVTKGRAGTQQSYNLYMLNFTGRWGKHALRVLAGELKTT